MGETRSAGGWGYSTQDFGLRTLDLGLRTYFSSSPFLNFLMYFRANTAAAPAAAERMMRSAPGMVTWKRRKFTSTEARLRKHQRRRSPTRVHPMTCRILARFIEGYYLG